MATPCSPTESGTLFTTFGTEKRPFGIEKYQFGTEKCPAVPKKRPDWSHVRQKLLY